MNYNDEIKSGTSVAGFDIGENINSYFPHLYLQEVEVYSAKAKAMKYIAILLTRI
nr:hypothetical protein [uncultured Capnocytophaga sp.]